MTKVERAAKELLAAMKRVEADRPDGAASITRLETILNQLTKKGR